MAGVVTGGFSVRKAKRRGAKLDPDFCRFIEAVIPHDSFAMDFGAGAYGAYVRWMKENGWSNVLGIDASLNSVELSDGLVLTGDITNLNFQLQIPRFPDWVVFSEVGEHIPSFLSHRVFTSLAVAKEGVLLSWATPGQRGTGHVNCRTPEWVACKMCSVGFYLDEEKTLELRAMTSKGWKRKVLVFKR